MHEPSRRTRTWRRSSSAISLSIALYAGQAFAQAPAAPEDRDPTEVVVTAQKRQQSINDVGMSITAVDGDTLQSLNINDTADLGKIVPGFTFTPTPSGPPVYTLRGVGFYESSLSSAPAVTVYVDEAPLAFPAMTQVGVIDVERVEVLEGPQGTLYGENSTGGAINYIAARPTQEFKAGGSFGYGRFDTTDAKGFISGPITDTLAGRFAFRALNSGTWQRSYTRGEQLGATRQFAARLLLDWQPTDRLKIKFTANGWRDRSDTQAYQLTDINCADPSRCAYSPDYPKPPAGDARAADWFAGWPMTVKNRFLQSTVRADYEFSPSVTLTSISGYQNLKIVNWQDLSATAIEQQAAANTGKIESFNQELRLSGTGNRLNWVAGLYYSYADINERNYSNTKLQSSTAPFPGLPGFTSVEAVTSSRLNTYAAFANADFRVTDHLSLVGGVRYTQANRSFSGCDIDPLDDEGKAAAIFNVLQTALLGSLVKPAVSGGCFTLDQNFLPNMIHNKLNENNVSWRAGANWKTDGGTLLYANIAQGYKSGSIPSVSAANYLGFEPVKQESLLAYEAGVKVPLFDKALRLNLAGFYYDYAKKQLRGRIVDPVFGLVEAMVSIPKSRVWGIEGSLVATPVEGLTLSGSGTYLNTKVQRYVGYNAAAQVEDYAGSTFPFSPKWQFVADGSYSWDIGNGKGAFAGANVTARDSSYASIGADPNFRLPSYALLGLRAGIESKDQGWRVTVWGENVTNKYYWTGVYQYWDTRFRLAAKPATYGIRLDYNY